MLPKDSFNLEILTTKEEIEKIKVEWSKFSNYYTDATPFQTPEWPLPASNGKRI
jgi:hypothetical protein